MNLNDAIIQAEQALEAHRALMEKSEEEEYIDTGDLINVSNNLAQACETLYKMVSL